MKLRSLLFSIPILAGIVILACGGDDDGPRRTGLDEVDAVIEAVEAQDAAALRSLALFQPLPCTTGAPSIDAPACADGEAEGVTVEAFEFYDCELDWRRDAELEDALAEITAIPAELYAAFETPVGYFPPGEYGLIFRGDDPRTDEAGLERTVAVGVGSGRIVAVAVGCSIDEPAHFLMPHDLVTFLVEPND